MVKICFKHPANGSPPHDRLLKRLRAIIGAEFSAPNCLTSLMLGPLKNSRLLSVGMPIPDNVADIGMLTSELLGLLGWIPHTNVITLRPTLALRTIETESFKADFPRRKT